MPQVCIHKSITTIALRATWEQELAEEEEEEGEEEECEYETVRAEKSLLVDILNRSSSRNNSQRLRHAAPNPN